MRKNNAYRNFQSISFVNINEEVILNETGVITTTHQAYHSILSYHRRVRVQIQSDIQISHPCYFCENQNTANRKNFHKR